MSITLEADSKQFLRNFWRVSFFQLINSASAFIINIIVASREGPQAFGNFYFYISMTLVAGILFDFGLSRTLLRYSAFHEARGEKREKLGTYAAVLRLRTAVGAAILFLGTTAALAWGGEVKIELVMAMLTAFIVGYCSFLAGVAQTEDDYTSYNLVLSYNTLRMLFVILLIVLGLVTNKMLYLVFIVTPILTAGMPARRLGRDLLQAWTLPENHFYSKLFRFGKWMIVLAVLETAYLRLDIILIRWLTNAEQAGYYSGALAFFGVVNLLPAFTAMLIYPRFVKAIGRGDEKALKHYYQFSLDLMTVIAVPLSLGLWAVAPDLIHGFLGAKYAASAPLFIYMAFYSLMLSGYLNSGGIFFAKDRPQLAVLVVVCILSINLGANLILIPRLGITGAGLSICLATGASLILVWSLIRRHFGLLPNFKHLLGYLLAGGVMALAVRSLPLAGWHWLALKILTGLGIYGGILWCLNRWNGRGWIPQGAVIAE